MAKILTLAFTETLALPLDIVTSCSAFLGTKNSGKTYASTKLAELMWDAGAQIICLDRIGLWQGLRRDGLGKGIPIPVFGGLYGDMPLDYRSGALIADVVKDRGISVVLDISQFDYDSHRERFAYEFMKRFFQRQKAAPSACCIFVEECHEFIPQNLPPSNTGEERYAPRMLHEFNRAVKEGRNFGIGLVLISQRPQDVNKKSLNLCQALFALRTTGPHERGSMVRWMGAETETDLNKVLPKLPTGEVYCWAPEFGIDRLAGKVLTKRSADVSQTPKVGAAARVVKPLTPIDLKDLQLAMAAQVEEQKTNDPKLLKAKIAELEKQLRLKSNSVQSRATTTATESDTALKTQITTLQQALRARDRYVASLQKKFATILSRANNAKEKCSQYFDEIAHQASELGQMEMVQVIEPKAILNGAGQSDGHNRAQLTKPSQNSNGKTRGGLPKRIVDVLYFYRSLGQASPTKKSIASLAGVKEAGHFNSTISTMRTNNIIDYPNPGRVSLTAAGEHQYPNSNERAWTLEDVHAAWLGKYGGLSRRLIEILIERYPDPISKTDLAARAGVVEAGHFNSTVSTLRTTGVLDYPQTGFVIATEMLFPEGLK